jgi:histone-lysine N-methyltransferase SETD2
MECIDGDCNCGRGCQNQRFQRKQYADVSVIKTEKKGYGLRVNTDLAPNEFIFEYVGEVINEPTFRRRTIQYDEEGIKHFYFMSLTKSEFVDATKKGNLGRFCNHSCAPNCYVDKWVVGEKLRMGIFAERHIKAGEELAFNYNVDRYGADPQPCYCGEPNCTGYIGGKTQTERATKLSHATIEALGIDDGDGWDTAVAKRPRKKKTGEDDEEYVNTLQPRGLDEDGVRKVMATLMQCKEKWIAVKLLNRIQRCGDDRVRNKVVQMHGYQILRTTLTTWQEDHNVVLQIFDILYKFPRLTRNKISDSKIEATVETLVNSEHEDVAFEAKRLIEEWSKLEVAYRIPRKKFDPTAAPVFERRNTEPAQPTKGTSATPIVAPTGPRSIGPQRNFTPSRPPVRRPFNPLPQGWFQAKDENGVPYYYSKTGHTQWTRPTYSAPEPPPPPKQPPKSVQAAKALQDIIDSITKADPSLQTPSKNTQPSSNSTPTKEKKKPEKWRSLPQEKQMKLYENTVRLHNPLQFPMTNRQQLFPHVKHVMQKFSSQLPKEDLKKFAKEVGKKLVASDFKNNRVEDPTKISEKQEKKVKNYVREYFEKAVEKKKAIDRKKREKAKGQGINGTSDDKVPKVNGHVAESESLKAEEAKEDIDIEMSDTEEDKALIASFAQPSPSIADSPTQLSQDLKRKREDEVPDESGEDTESHKRLKEDNQEDEVSPPPPPPPPPSGEMPDMMALQEGEDLEEESEEQQELRRQEEELMRENEEALRMDLDGTLKAEERDSKRQDHNTVHYAVGDIVGMPPVPLNGAEDGTEEGMKVEHERKGVLSH